MATVQSSSAQAFHYGRASQFLNPIERGNICGRLLRGVARLIYGLAVMTFAPPVGVCYHAYKAVATRRWEHVEAMGVDLALAFVSIMTLFFAYKAALTLPGIIKEMGQFRDLPITLANQRAYMAVQRRFQLEGSIVVLPLIMPLLFAVAPNGPMRIC